MAQLPDRFAVRALARIEPWAQATRSGDLAEIEGLDERSPVIPLVTSTRENCLGAECPEYRACHVMQARREAMAADLVVVNHHLFFADLALRDSGVAELLPTVDVAVFDEAHQLVEAGVQFLGTHARHRPGARLRARPAGAGPAAGARPAALAGAARPAASAPRASCAWPAPARCARCAATLKLRWEERADALQRLRSGAGGAGGACAAARRRSTALPRAAPDLPKLRAARARAGGAGRTASREAAGRARCAGSTSRRSRRGWSSRRWTSARCCASSVSAGAQGLDLHLGHARRRRAPVAGSREPRRPRGRATLRVGSPFDYRGARPRLCVPVALAASPTSRGIRRRWRAGRALRARARRPHLRADDHAARAAAHRASAARAGRGAGDALEVLVQGSAAASARCCSASSTGRGSRAGRLAELLGGHRRARRRAAVRADRQAAVPAAERPAGARRASSGCEAQGRNPFDDYFVAEAAVSLKQGAGRLIRTRDRPRPARGVRPADAPDGLRTPAARGAAADDACLQTRRRRWRGWPNWRRSH